MTGARQLNMIIVSNVLEFVENGVGGSPDFSRGWNSTVCVIEDCRGERTGYVEGPKQISLKGVPSQGEMSISDEHVVNQDVVEGDLCLTGVLSSSSSM